MAKQIIQYRYGTNDDNINRDDLLAGIQLPICQLSIETVPGMKFIIGDSAEIIGVTGIYELVLNNINKISLDSQSYEILAQKIAQGDSRYKLIINIVYDE